MNDTTDRDKVYNLSQAYDLYQISIIRPRIEFLVGEHTEQGAYKTPCGDMALGNSKSEVNLKAAFVMTLDSCRFSLNSKRIPEANYLSDKATVEFEAQSIILTTSLGER